MNKLLQRALVVTLLISGITLSAQNVGINGTGAAPNPYAILDVASTTNSKGILIPRLTTGERSGIAGLGVTEEGLTVYDETTNSYWLWDGTQWVQFMMSGDAWTLTGNAGTNPGTNFIGTTDAQDLVIRTNNLERMRVKSNGRVGIGTGTPNAELTVNGWIGRTAHNNGALAGSYNNVGANSSQSNPIYVIGTSYKPAAATLTNMYGVGYTHTNASFLNGAGSWGFYVAADGDARIWLGASNGGESYFNTGGYFGLNTNAPTRPLDVNGSIRIRGGGPTAGDFLMCQDGTGNATWSAAGYGMVPIGSIVGWHGNMAGVPGLPAGWLECNGQTISDGASPMNGQVVPNLNNTTTSESGDVSRGRFLRGSTISGLLQQDLANNLDWVNNDDSGNGDTNDYLDDDGAIITIRSYNTNGDRFQLNVDGYETRVTNMSVRWIIRIK